MQGKFTDECVQCQMPEDEEELMKGKFTSGLTGTLQAKEETPPNKTGMPDNLKSGIENISGMELSGVRVHYNSSKPGQLNALAYTQGVDIHVAPGQEQHLPHEAWHVVQQAQGRVKPTMQLKDGVPVNNDKGLEHEADVMGAKAVEKTVQFQGPEEEELLQGKFGVVKLKHEPSPQHAKGCACHGCTTQSGVKALSSTVQGKMYGAGIGLIQLKECWYCGYENGHAPGCTPEARAKAAKEKKDANRRAADQSNDNRTRKDQSHPHHGNKNVKKAWKK
ncbi:TPA: DUF4157 domain-containing protein [Methanosarcinaceae archaeon]|nr:DUF4157 domain-containing protein [Methanosarcinaceae archaeon]